LGRFTSGLAFVHRRIAAVGREFYDESDLRAAALPTTDAITVSTGGRGRCGRQDRRVARRSTDDHMGDVVIMLVPPSAPTE
jgi:hypothetical protein